MKVQPDLTRTVLPNDKITANEKLTICSDENEIVFKKEPISGLTKTVTDYLLHKDPGTMSAEEEECIYAQPDASPDDIDVNRTHSFLSSQFPGNVDADAVVWATLTHAGGRIALPYSGSRILVQFY